MALGKTPAPYGIQQPYRQSDLLPVTKIPLETNVNPTPPTASVTSVGLDLPASTFSVTGSPVTTSGTLTGAFTTQTANTLFAGPATGIPAVPTWRAMVAADIPATTVTAGSYGSATQVGTFTVDAAGRLTAAANVTITAPTLQTARTIAMSGDVVWSVSFDGSGNVTAAGTIQPDAVTNAKLADMAAHTLKANITGSSDNPVDSSLSAILDAEISSTKGAMIVRGTSTWATFPVGANTYLIVADSAQTLGMKWAPAPSSAGITVGLDKDRPAASLGTQVYVSTDAKITYTSDGTNWYTTFGPDKIYIGPFSTANYYTSQFAGTNTGPIMSNPYTILIGFNVISLPGTTRNVMISYGNAGGTTGWYLSTSQVNSNKIIMFQRGVNSSGETEFAGMTALTTGAHSLAISWDGSNYNLVLDGGSAVTVATTGTFTPAASGDSCFIGKFANSSLPCANIGISYIYGYASALSTGDKQTLTTTPGNYFPGPISTAPAWVFTAKTAIYGSVSRTWGTAVNAAGTSNMQGVGSLAYVLP